MLNFYIPIGKDNRYLKDVFSPSDANCVKHKNLVKFPIAANSFLNNNNNKRIYKSIFILQTDVIKLKC